MFCKVCGTENAEDSLFCKQCGAKLDDKNLCPSCEAENDADALFCRKCGTALTTTVKPQPEPVVAESDEITTATTKPTNWKRTVEIVGWTFAMTGLFFAVLFTFLIGVSVKANSEDISSIVGNSSNYLYYYFSDVYEALESQIQLYDYSDAEPVALYLPAVLGTVVSAGVILSVVILAIVSTVKFVKHAQGDTTQNFAKPTIATYLVFLLGSIALLGLNHGSVSASSMLSASESVSASVTLNSTTIAGIVLGAVGMGVYVASRVLVKGKDIVKNLNYVHVILGTVGVALLCVMIGILPRGAIGMTMRSSYYRESVTIAIPMLMPLTVRSFEDLAGPLVVSSLAECIQIVLLALVVVTVLKQALNAYRKKQESALPLSITILLLAVGYLVLTIVFGNMVADIIDDEGVKLSYISAIVGLVFAVLHLGVSIAQMVCTQKQSQLIQTQLVEE